MTNDASHLVRPPIKPGMLVTFRQAYSPDIRKGTVCKVDAMRKSQSCASGFSVRVAIPGDKYMHHFDAGWFDEYHAWRELLKLRKIAAHVPGEVYIEAKERAGYADQIFPLF